MPGLPMLVLINATLRPRFDGWVEELEDEIGHDVVHGHRVRGLLPHLRRAVAVRLGRRRAPHPHAGAHAARRRSSSSRRRRAAHRRRGSCSSTSCRTSCRSSSSALRRALGAIALAEIGLTFLGVGIQPPHPSFGALITDGAPRSVLENHPQLLLVPGERRGLADLRVQPARRRAERRVHLDAAIGSDISAASGAGVASTHPAILR